MQMYIFSKPVMWLGNKGCKDAIFFGKTYEPRKQDKKLMHNCMNS